MPLQFHSIETIEKFVKFISEKTKNTDICEEEIRQLLLEHPILKDRVIVNINQPFEFTDPTYRAGAELPRPRLRRTDSVSDYGMDSLRKYNPTGQHLVTYKAIDQARQDDESLEWSRKTLEIIGPDLESLLRQFNCIINHEYNLPYTALQAGQANHGGAGQHQPVKIIPIEELEESCPFPMVARIQLRDCAIQEEWRGKIVAFHPHRYKHFDKVAALMPALSEEDAETLERIVRSGGIPQYLENEARKASHAASILAQPMVDGSGNRKWLNQELIVAVATFLADADIKRYLKATEPTSARSPEVGASEQKDPREEEMAEESLIKDEAKSTQKMHRTKQKQEGTAPFISLLTKGKLKTIQEKAVRPAKASDKKTKNKPPKPKGFGSSVPRFGPNTSTFNRGRKKFPNQSTLEGILQR
ncbi:MAG: hypothetical protein HOI53_09290 [Francisellaceae bacterium]|nr:hypothetical protein [Francisellaceae bacterium]